MHKASSLLLNTKYLHSMITFAVIEHATFMLVHGSLFKKFIPAFRRLRVQY